MNIKKQDFDWDKFKNRVDKNSLCRKIFGRAKVIKLNDKLRYEAMWLKKYPNY